MGQTEAIDNDGYSIMRMGNSRIPFITSDKPLKINEHIAIYTTLITLTPID